MNEQDVINYSKETMKEVMTEFLFAPINEDNLKQLEYEIARRISVRDYIDFYVDVINEDDSIKVVLEIYDVMNNKRTEIVARYSDCPVIHTFIDSLKVDKKTLAYERAMEII